MGQIILVRHGQANSGAQTEEEYDQLSEIGRQQAVHLGNWLRERGKQPDRILRGTLNRHASTIEAMGDLGRVPEVDGRLNELDYLTLGRALEQDHGVPQPGPDQFLDHFIEVMLAWKAARISGQESYDNFEKRVTEILQEAAEPGRVVLCITSGGVIAMMIRHLLRLDLPAMARIALPIWNSSLHEIAVSKRGALLTSFNAIPHLDDHTRSNLRTRF